MIFWFYDLLCFLCINVMFGGLGLDLRSFVVLFWPVWFILVWYRTVFVGL